MCVFVLCACVVACACVLDVMCCVLLYVCVFVLLLGVVCAFERVLDVRCRCVLLVIYHVMLHALILLLLRAWCLCVWLCEFVNACVLFVIDCGVLTELDFVCVG